MVLARCDGMGCKASEGGLGVGCPAAEVPAGAGLLQSVVDGLPPLAAPNLLLPQGALEVYQVSSQSLQQAATLDQVGQIPLFSRTACCMPVV